jgi:hypothetical protein
MKRQALTKWLPGAMAVLAFLCGPGCEKEDGDATGPIVSRPDSVLIVASADTVLTAGRDMAIWNVQLYRNGSPFGTPWAVTMLTDLGYFDLGGVKVEQATFATGADGKTTVQFYGGHSPGFATTLVWGDGFGIDTVRTVLVYGSANTLRVEFRDFAADVWKSTDTLISGAYRGKADSNQVRVTVLDIYGAPVPAVRVDLAVLRNGVKALRSTCGYFQGTRKPDSIATSAVFTDAGGQAFEVYYSDDSPNSGMIDVQIYARVDSAFFGRVSTMKYLVLRAP